MPTHITYWNKKNTGNWNTENTGNYTSTVLHTDTHT